MFTSTIVSVLAPHWNLRRQKKGISEVEQGIQVSGQNSTVTPSSQNARQKSFLLSHMQPRGEAIDKFSSMLKGPAEPSRNYAAWQKESNSPNPTLNFQSRRSFLESSFLNADRQTVYSNAEFDTSVSKPALSAQLGGYKRMSQGGDQRESFSSSSSRPTSSSLLLSWRRNSRKASDLSTQADKQLPTSVNSLTLPRNIRLSTSQPHIPTCSPNDSAKEVIVPYATYTSPAGLPGVDKSPVSPRGRETEASGRPLFLNKRESAISNNTLSARSETTREGEFLNPSTRLSHLKALKGFRHNSKDVLERKYSHAGNRESEEQSITHYANVHNSNISRQQNMHEFPSTSISLKDNKNSNFIHSQTEFNGQRQRQISQASVVSPNHRSGASWQSDGTHNLINYSNANTINTPSVSKSTIASASHTSPNTIQSLSVSHSAGLTSMPMIQDSQNSIQKSVINKNNVCAEKHLSSPVNSVNRKTFTNSLTLSPRKEPSAVKRTSPSRVWHGFLNSQRQSQTNPGESDKAQTPSDLTSLPSPSRTRRDCAVSIYTYLRETSPLIATGTSLGLSSACPQSASVKQDRGQIQREDKNSEASRFTFDLSPTESQDWLLTKDLYTSSSPQSLPPEIGIRSAARFTNSPYAFLISARPALNSTLHSTEQHFTAVSLQRNRSASYDSSAMESNPPKTEKNTYPSLKGKDSLILWTAGKPATSVENQLSARDRQIVNFIPDTSHPKECKIISKNNTSQSAKVNNHELKCKDLSSPLNTPTVSETVSPRVQQGNMTMPTQEKLERISKTTVLSLRSEKNDLLFSAPSIDKGSEDDDLTVRRKNFNQQHSDFKVSENTAEEEKRYPKCKTFKSPKSSNTQDHCLKESLNSSSPVSDFTIRNRKQENSLTVDEHKRLSDESGNWSPRRSLSPNWPKHDHINRYATMPQSRKPTLIPSPTFNPFDFDSANDDVFYTPVSRRRYSSLCETEDVPHPGNTKNAGRKHFTRNILSASCADLKYGLEHGRSVSVNSVVSGRPSGPGRISVGSKPGSTTDITGLDEFVTQGSLSSIGNPCDSPRYGATSPRNHPIHNAHKGDIGGLMSGGRLWGPVNLETSLTVDTDADPTPPPSPPFSPTSRCMARIPSSSSTSSRTSQDSLSPRGHLPSRDYKSTLPVFEESPNSSETTTDDEYYVNSDDDDDDDDDDDNDDEEKETEL